MDIGYDNKCHSSLAIASSSRQPHILFFVSNSKVHRNNQIENSDGITLLFHPRPSSEKLVHIIRRLAEDDSAGQDEARAQIAADRLGFDVSKEAAYELSSSLPDVSAVKLNGIQTGKKPF